MTQTGWRRAAKDALWLALHSFSILRNWWHPPMPGPGPDDGAGRLSDAERERFGSIERAYYGDPADSDWWST